MCIRDRRRGLSVAAGNAAQAGGEQPRAAGPRGHGGLSAPRAPHPLVRRRLLSYTRGWGPA
eukprot:7399131-Lingulodinium_polyedra.AAC.1